MSWHSQPTQEWWPWGWNNHSLYISVHETGILFHCQKTQGENSAEYSSPILHDKFSIKNPQASRNLKHTTFSQKNERFSSRERLIFSTFNPSTGKNKHTWNLSIRKKAQETFSRNLREWQKNLVQNDHQVLSRASNKCKNKTPEKTTYKNTSSVLPELLREQGFN